MNCHQISFKDYIPDHRASLGGSPWLAEHQTWPECAHCQTPLTFFMQFPILAEWGSELTPGSQLGLFMCLKHDDPLMPPEHQGSLPANYWELPEDVAEYSQFLLQLLPADASLKSQASQPGLRPQGLSFSLYTEIVDQSGKDARGESIFKIGGVPSWFQDPESYTCCCGAPMDFLGQIPKDYEFAKQAEAPHQSNSMSQDSYSLFLGNEVYILACRAQCHPRALWPISQ